MVSLSIWKTGSACCHRKWFPKVLNVSMLQLLISSHHNRKSMVSHSDYREHIKLLLCTHANKRTMFSCSTNKDHAQTEF